MQDTLKPLRYAVRLKVLGRYLGLLALLVACLATAPLLASLWFGEYEFSKRYLIVIALLVVGGLPTLRLPYPADVQHNESLAITALAFVVTPLLMCYPMMGAGLGFIDAWFEAVSAVTTTGLSTVAELERMPRTFLFARAWMQWYGGLGIVVLSVAIVMEHHIALRRLVNPAGDSLVTTTRLYARRMFVVYVLLTVAGLALLTVLLNDAFQALAYTLSAVSTGGFAPQGDSLATLPWPAQFAVTLLGLCGAIPLVLYYRLAHGNWREVWADFEVRTLLLLTLLLCLALTVTLNLQPGMDWRAALHHGLLLGISAQTTTGFSSLEPRDLDALSLGLVILAMVSGGGVGSTAGGFKILRLLILLRLLQLLVKRTGMTAHAVTAPRLGDRPLESDEIERALLLIILFIVVIVLSWLAFLASGHAPLASLFEVVSATGTVGLSTGLSSHELEPLLKAVLAVDMLLGRVEIIALLVVLYPGTWLGKRTE